MPERSTNNAPTTGISGARWRKEALIAAISLGLGFVVLPAVIYGVGVKMLGDYGGGPHIGSFYGEFFRNLAAGTGRTWFIGFAPYLLLWILRLVFWRWERKTPPPVAAPRRAPGFR